VLEHQIDDVRVHLVSHPLDGNLSDATRKVESIGFTIVRVHTSSGFEGIGITYHEVGGEATKELILRNMKPRLLGRNPFATEEIFQDMFGYLRGVGRKGLMLAALSAVDIALWDLKGKILDIPLFQLLGGTRTCIPVYASGGWTSYSDEELVNEIEGMIARGYSMVKLKVGVEGGTNMRRDIRRVERVRAAVGDEIGIMLDANNCWDAATAIQFANRVRDLDIMWLEEPVPADDIPGLARFHRGTDIPLATGEHEYTKFGVRDLLMGEAADIVQVDGARGGGFTEMIKIAALTQAWNVKFAPHAMENVQAHLVSMAPNALFLERLLMFEDITAKVFADVPVPRNGYLEIPDLPGLGLVLDEEYVVTYDET
jgi:L-alanine-DL-glutamate epimerase-like enolase superfamily enzyme